MGHEMMRMVAVLLLTLPTAARAGEFFAGIYAHDVNWITRSGIEDGTDLELGWRGERMAALSQIGSPSPHLFLSANDSGDTHFASAGLNWKFGRKVYARPGIGLAVHSGPSHFDRRGERIYLGSPILFAPELGIGVQISDRISVEASWVHLSHATLLSRQNPGLDTVGVRINFRP